METTTFSSALEHMKLGGRATKKSLGNMGIFIFMQVPAEIDIDVVPKMQSLPQSVKDEFIARSEGKSKAVRQLMVDHKTIRYNNQMAIVYPCNSIFGWSPSAADCLSNDWILL